MFVYICIRERDCMRRRICTFMGACVGVYVGVRELIACLHMYVRERDCMCRLVYGRS